MRHYRLLCLSRRRLRRRPVLSAVLVPGRGTFGGISAWIGNVTRVFSALKPGLDAADSELGLSAKLLRVLSVLGTSGF